MYTLYFCIYAGAVILIFRALFPNIHWYQEGQIVIGNECIIGWILLIVSCAALCLLSVNKKKQTGWKQKFAACAAGILGYFSLIMILMPSINNAGKPINTGSWLIILFSIFVWIGYPLAIALGFRSNIASIRGIKPDEWVNAAAVIMFLGTMAVSIVAEYQMILYNTVSAIIINCLILFFAGIVLPYLIGEVLTKDQLTNQLVKNKPTAGVAQDGVLYSMLAMLSELLTVFFIGSLQRNITNFAEVTGLLISGAVYLSIMTWPLEYCINNNIDHYNKRKEESQKSDLQAGEEGARKEERAGKEKMLAALLKHLRMQNVNTLFISLPYSLYLINTKIFEYGLGDGNDIKQLIATVLPGVELSKENDKS